MSKLEKLFDRLKSQPKDFTFTELTTLLNGLGYQTDNRGKTSGSASRFVNAKTSHIIRLHKPHPGNILKTYIINYLLDELKKEGYIK